MDIKITGISIHNYIKLKILVHLYLKKIIGKLVFKNDVFAKN